MLGRRSPLTTNRHLHAVSVAPKSHVWSPIATEFAWPRRMATLHARGRRPATSSPAVSGARRDRRARPPGSRSFASNTDPLAGPLALERLAAPQAAPHLGDVRVRCIARQVCGALAGHAGSFTAVGGSLGRGRTGSSRLVTGQRNLRPACGTAGRSPSRCRSSRGARSPACRPARRRPSRRGNRDRSPIPCRSRNRRSIRSRGP